MSDVAILIDAEPGEPIDKFCERLAGGAKILNVSLVGAHNGVLLRVKPGETSVSLAARWNDAMMNRRRI